MNLYKIEHLNLGLQGFAWSNSYQHTWAHPFIHYLIQNFGESAIANLMLYPDTVVDVTGKSWDTLKATWKQSIMDKYAGKEIPNWLREYLT